jgi:ABC-2 type transport system permease protein
VAPASALARRLFADSRVRNITYAALFALVGYVNAVTYRSTYPTTASRIGFERAFGSNASVRLFYGRPFQLLTVGGYTAWKAGGTLAIIAGMWGVLAAVRALRAEEDAGRQELVLSGALTRRQAYGAAVAAILAGGVLLGLAMWLGLIAAALPAGQSALLMLSTMASAAVFAGVGAIACQFASTRRVALELGSAALALSLVLRVVADTTTSLQWLGWVTPLGWSEQVRAFAGARPAALLPSLVVCAATLTVAGMIAARRDVGSSLLPAHDSAAPRMRGLSSPAALALRDEAGSLAGWILGTGFFALIIGLVSTSVSKAGLSGNLQKQVNKLASVAITQPAGYIGLCFLFFVLSTSLFCCSQIAAARHEESEDRLETMFSLPVDRSRWLGGRLALALGGALAISIGAGVCAWAGAAIEGTGVSLSSMLEAGLNCLPAALLFLSLAALAFALAPRASSGVAYGLVAIAFLWDLFGSLVGAPHWVVDITPFQHIGLVPAESLRLGAAAVMLGVAALASLASVWAFRRRDLIGR